jgi:hypothetical protein
MFTANLSLVEQGSWDQLRGIRLNHPLVSHRCSTGSVTLAADPRKGLCRTWLLIHPSGKWHRGDGSAATAFALECSGPRVLLSDADQDWAQLCARSLRGTSYARRDDDAFNRRECRPLREANVFGIRYCYPPMHVNGSDPRAVHTAGINLRLSTRIGLIWHRGKASISRLLAPPEIPTVQESTCSFPYEIVEMIVTHIAHDPRALKACSLTCHSWYMAAVPHLHHTLILTGNRPGITRGGLKPLFKLHKLGLMPLIKEIQLEQWGDKWFVPQAFSDRDLCHFSTFTNVQTLRLQDLEIYRFIPGIERYFGHFSPTLRSIALKNLSCTPQELSHFLSLFPNLDDIKIWGMAVCPPDVTIHNPGLVPFSTPRLRGRLVLYNFAWAETWMHLVAPGGGLRFHYMELYRVGGCAPVLFEACAETVETLRFSARGQ